MSYSIEYWDKRQRHHDIQRRKELETVTLPKIKSLFLRQEKGTDLYFKTGRWYRRILNDYKKLCEVK